MKDLCKNKVRRAWILTLKGRGRYRTLEGRNGGSAAIAGCRV